MKNSGLTLGSIQPAFDRCDPSELKDFVKRILPYVCEVLKLNLRVASVLFLKHVADQVTKRNIK